MKSIRTIALVHDASTPEEVEAKGHELIAEGHATLARARRMQKSPRADLNSRTNLPPGDKTGRAFRAACKNIPGAYRQGNVWVCPVDAWEAYHRAQSETNADESGEVDAYEAACRRGAK